MFENLNRFTDLSYMAKIQRVLKVETSISLHNYLLMYINNRRNFPLLLSVSTLCRVARRHHIEMNRFDLASMPGTTKRFKANFADALRGFARSN